MDGLNNNQAVSEFVDKLIEEKSFPDLTEEVKAEIKKDILVRLDDFISARIIAKLSDEDVQTFNDLLKENKSPEEVQQFISTHVPDFTNFLTSTLLEFREVYLGLKTAPPAVESNLPQ
ncbi:MAG: hypothetical protein HYW45_03715 [Candidatus Daviesbacteria bacterium]|nr:MAG: hypothetical protein HYW45_03715 [Candidatus Daviesbacteria bacterium]